MLQGLMILLALVSANVMAESKYPAADFKPTVVFKDEDAIAKNKEVAKQTAKSQESAPVMSVSAKSAESAPAANTSISSNTATAKKDDSTQTYLLAAVAVAVVGFFLFGKRSGSGSESSASGDVSYTADVSGLTGVARYLNKIEGKPMTGVARYLEKHAADKPALTRVEKYLRSQRS